MWLKSVWERAKDLLYADEATVQEYLLGAIESFTPAQLVQAVNEHYDVMPGLQEKMGMRSKIAAPIAKAVIKNNRRQIFELLTNPGKALLAIEANDQQKATILRTPEGWTWWTHSIYHVTIFLQEFAKVYQDYTFMPPPTPCPIYSVGCVPGATPR